VSECGSTFTGVCLTCMHNCVCMRMYIPACVVAYLCVHTCQCVYSRVCTGLYLFLVHPHIHIRGVICRPILSTNHRKTQCSHSSLFPTFYSHTDRTPFHFRRWRTARRSSFCSGRNSRRTTTCIGAHGENSLVITPSTSTVRPPRRRLPLPVPRRRRVLR
jgi:hypothetical protein